MTDLSHVLTTLNKVRPSSSSWCQAQGANEDVRVQLDAGVDEKIMLVSRDEQSCLIVSYREV